jgi:hypothetical protein
VRRPVVLQRAQDPGDGGRRRRDHGDVGRRLRGRRVVCRARAQFAGQAQGGRVGVGQPHLYPVLAQRERDRGADEPGTRDEHPADRRPPRLDVAA